MADKTKEIIDIAKKVNAMTDFEIRQRIRELEKLDISELYLEELMEIQFLGLKILSMVNQ